MRSTVGAIGLTLGWFIVTACGGSGPEGSGPVKEDKVVPCACTAGGTVTGTIDGRQFAAVATGIIRPGIGNLEIMLYETGSSPICHESGKVEIPDGGGTRIRVALCLPPLDGVRTIGGNGGPVGTHCSERPTTAGASIADPGDTGLLLNGGNVEISNATRNCVSGTLNATHFRIENGNQMVTERLGGTFTVPNASCYAGWTDSVFKYCPPG